MKKNVIEGFTMYVTQSGTWFYKVLKSITWGTQIPGAIAMSQNTDADVLRKWKKERKEEFSICWRMEQIDK